MECINECIQYEECIGIYVSQSEGACLLMDTYSQYHFVPGECSNYVLKTPQIDYPGATPNDTKLNDIEQLLYNLMYASNGTCPHRWKVESTTCSLYFDYKSDCDNYSALLKTYWNGTYCLTDKRF
uniref:Apple domain-containing protein n=1 Tax=Panagrellus redivivus TaxID=6233 RepID=A0A7E4W5D3_PANRE